MRTTSLPCPHGRASWRGLAVLAVAIAAKGPEAPARQAEAGTPTGPAQAVSGRWVPVFRHHADAYVIAAGADGGGAAQRLPEPVLRWWQPIRGGDDGALYLWMGEGRPVAAVTFFTFKWPDGNRAVVHECHSLATSPVKAAWRGQARWSAARPGVTFAPIPDAPAPAATAPARLR